MDLPTAHRITTAVEAWFAQHQRPLPWRRHYDAYAVWVSEIMLQQTRMEVVLPYHARFLSSFPDVQSLASAPFDDVHALWSGLGYYRRAKMLHDGARYVVDRLDGIVPQRAEDLRKIPGIGRYTAGAIASIAYEQHEAIVDGNVARLLARILELEEPLGSRALDKLAWAASEQLVGTCSSPRAFNQGLMELGATLCTPRNADCMRCSVRKECGAFANDRVHELPMLAEKGPTRELTIPLFVVTGPGGRVLLLRASGALMSGMFHLPHGNGLLLPSVAVNWAPVEKLGSFRHTVTNRRITFEVVTATTAGTVRDGVEATWAGAEELEKLPHPSYVAKALALTRSLAVPSPRRRKRR